MINKLKIYLKHPSVRQLQDVRVLGLMVFVIIALLVSWSGVATIQTNYELQKQISALKQQNEVQKLENDTIRFRNDYYKTDEYLELVARRQFGKAAAGETVYIVPKAVALANTIDIPTKQEKPRTKADDRPTYQKNIEAWLNFFLNRQ